MPQAELGAYIEDIPDGVRMTREAVALGCDTSVRSVDRARSTDPPLLGWHYWNSDRIRIWSQDARAWYRKGCPTKIAALTFIILLVA